MEVFGSERLTCALRTAIERYDPRVVIETGTYLGLGSTHILAEAFTDAPPDRFFTIEVSRAHYDLARENLADYPFVELLWGLSIERAAAERFVLEESGQPEFYLHEIRGGFGGAGLSLDAPDRLLEKLLREHADACPLIALDSAGGVGWLEFTEVVRLMEGRPYVLFLDDVTSEKHERSREHIESSPEFFVLDVFERDGWLVAACNAEARARSYPFGRERVVNAVGR